MSSSAMPWSAMPLSVNLRASVTILFLLHIRMRRVSLLALCLANLELYVGSCLLRKPMTGNLSPCGFLWFSSIRLFSWR